MSIERRVISPVIIGVFFVLLLLLFPSVAHATPNAPRLTEVSVYNGSDIYVSWNPSSDVSTGTIQYTLYRYYIPITTSNYLSAEVVTVTTETAGVFSPAVDELDRKFTLFYAVRAQNIATTNWSSFSYSKSPDPHGGWIERSGTDLCTDCHSVHGTSINYKTKELCYLCHGDTNSGTSYGDRSTIDVERQFFDYGDQTAGSQHRSSAMTTNEVECRACHTTHRSPYYVDNSDNYVGASSYKKLLRVKTGSSTYKYYGNSTVPASNNFCLDCHGSTSANMSYVDANAYSATAGNHTYGANSIHGDSTVLTSSTNPEIQCETCHNNHGSATTKLLDYRMSGTNSSSTNREANLCFQCHNTGTSESDVAVGYSPPYSWNNRDVKSEFTSGVSSHPYMTAASGGSATCVSCHNPHQVQEGGTTAWNLNRVSSPSNTLNTPSDFTSFCLDCHTTSPPTAVINDTTLVPYSITFSSLSSYPYITSWDKNSTFSNSGHYTSTVANGQALCINCHDPHASAQSGLNAWTIPSGVTWVNGNSKSGVRDDSSANAKEEALCYNCHGNGTASYPRANGAKDVYTKANLSTSHPISTSNIHVNTENSTNLGVSNRHSECVDCHDSHTARKVSGSATQDSWSSISGGAVYGVKATQPTYSGTNWTAPTGFTSQRLAGGSSELEANLCFKCHSNNTTQPSAQTNTALQFNPSNYSYHNVTGQSVGMQSVFAVKATTWSTTQTVTWGVPTVGVFRSGLGLTSDSAMTCTDCHTNEQNSATQAKGPHGSNVNWLIDPNYPQDWKMAGLDSGATYGIGFDNGSTIVDGTGVICAKCHDLTGGSNSAHTRKPHYITHRDTKYCVNCHIQIPHGWKRPRLLGYSSDGSPYGTTNNGASSFPLDGVEASSRSVRGGSVTWNCTDCKTTGGNKHVGSSYVPNPWP